jgi:uncharacterized protein YebE (UPF0316 family)
MEFLNFFTGSSIWVYLFIFFGKIIEVTISTLRIVLISRGERMVGSFAALFEITIWIMVTGTVLVNFQHDLIKVLVFAVAFATGNYFGSWLEEKLAFGLCSLHVIVQEIESIDNLVCCLRAENFGVTILNGRGKDGDRKLLIVSLRRKRINQAIRIIEENSSNAFVTACDVKIAKGGYLKK